MTEIKQKINLYLPRFQPEKLSKETKNLFFAISAAFAILVLIIASLMIMNSLVDSKIVNNQQKSEVLNKKLEQAISKIPNVTADSNLVNRIKQQKSVIKILLLIHSRQLSKVVLTIRSEQTKNLI